MLLTDKARFPRDKPCGGGITVRAERQLPFSIDTVVEDAVDVFDLRLGYGRHFRRRTREPLIRMTQRRRLDAFLVEQAREAGAVFRDGFRPDDTIDAKVVIGADGANGTTGRGAGLDDHLRTVALEGNARVDLGRFAGRAWIEFGVVPGGYGWVFPKADHVNVGVGGWHEEGPRLRAHLARLCSEHGIPIGACRRAWPPAASSPARLDGGERTTGPRGRCRRPRRPGLGDGIYEAVLSARLAAANALDILAGRTADFSRMQENCDDDSLCRRLPHGGRRRHSTASREPPSRSCRPRSRGAGSSRCSAPTPRSLRTSAARAARRSGSRKPSPGCRT